MTLTRWSTSLFQWNTRSVSGKTSLHSSFWFHYKEGKWTSWRFWVTLNLQLIHKVPFFKTSYRQFDLFSYIYGKKDFRKINIFFSPTYVSFLTLPHHWGLLAEELSLRQGRWIRWQIQQNWIWAFKVVLEVGWFIIRAMFTGNSTKARELDCNTFTSYSNSGHKELNSEIINVS